MPAPLGAWLAFGRPPAATRTPPDPGDRCVTALALVVGAIGGIYGIGGGFIDAGLQSRLPEVALRRGLGLLALALAARYGAGAIL